MLHLIENTDGGNCAQFYNIYILVECEHHFQKEKTKFYLSFNWALVQKYSFQHLRVIGLTRNWVPTVTFVVQACALNKHKTLASYDKNIYNHIFLTTTVYTTCMI